MNQALSNVFLRAALLSRIAVLAAVALSVVSRLLGFEISNSAQVVLAIIALAVGIPHGAIDHLITIPRESKRKFILFIISYTLIAIFAGMAISRWNLAGFQIVVVMSALHFGFGDASYFNEARRAEGSGEVAAPLLAIYAIPAGFLPVVLPLTDVKTHEVLNKLNPRIINWSGSYTELIRDLTFITALLSIVILILTRNLALAVDLSMLSALAALAPPLIAFSIYFGCWHAIRHTARLVPKLPRAMEKVAAKQTFNALIAAVKPGLYAILGVFILGIALMARGTDDLTNEFFWTILVIIWALTVPHMATTARFDLAAFKKSLRP
jgi:Brp/Blh family beta-carotene 15,15'-monooxygenase